MSTAVVTLATAELDEGRGQIVLSFLHNKHTETTEFECILKPHFTSILWSKEMQTLLFLPTCFHMVINGVWGHYKKTKTKKQQRQQQY